ncbi:MAG: VOC family protein [Actinobacteria bacterium]|nr:VOC family protein [Actinomycetota bacterium]
MQRIVPNLWFDHKAAEAAEFYSRVFPDTHVAETARYPEEGLLEFQKEFAGDVLSVAFEIRGYRFMGINAGPEVSVNPSISFMVNFPPDQRAELDALWEGLAEGGQVRLALGEYPYSGRYGWVEDRYGVNWQLYLLPDGTQRPFIMPNLMFTETQRGRVGEAIDFYTSVFGGKVGVMQRYEQQTQEAAAGSVQFADFELLGQWFAAMEAPVSQGFSFSPGVSLMVSCADQAELDRYWEQLSHVPEAEQCGWCTDQFGVSWQLVPADLDRIMSRPGSFGRLMAMKKIEIGAFG